MTALRRRAAFCLALLVLAPVAAAQPAPAPAERPRGQRPAPVVSPEVHPDRTVTFRVRAPNAQKVSVSGEWPGGEKEMTRGEQGVWSVTVGPLPDWLTVKVWPAAVMVPLRCVVPLLDTAYETVPLPVPLAPPVTVRNAALLTAVHAQPARVVTLKLLEMAE